MNQIRFYPYLQLRWFSAVCLYGSFPVDGISNSKKLLEDIPNKVGSMLGISVDVNLLVEGDAEYLEIVVPSYQVAISYKGVFFYRSGSTNQRLQGSSLVRFILEKQGVSWDSLTIPNVSVGDLDSIAIASFKENAVGMQRLNTRALDESDTTLLEKLNLVVNGELTYAAVLLFHPEPQRFFPGAYTRIGYFEDGYGLRYEDTVRGSLLEQAVKVPELLLTKYLKNWVYYEGMVRNERYAFPPDAIREIVYNALVHARYAARIPIQVKVYDDRIYFSNAGGLPDTRTVEKLFEQHSSMPPNPDIAHAFYLAGYIESWGQGINLICDACTADGIELPTYTIHPDDIMVMLKTTEARAKGFTGSNEPVNEPVNEPLGKTLRRVFEKLQADGHLTKEALAHQVGLSRATVTRALKALQDSGYITRVGSDKTGHWETHDR